MLSYVTGLPFHALRCVRSWLSWDSFPCLFVYLADSLSAPIPLYRFGLSSIPVELSSNPLESPRQPYVAINSSNLMLVHLAFACDTSFS